LQADGKGLLSNFWLLTSNLPSTRPDPLRLVVIVAITAALTVRAVFWLTDPSATQTSDSSTEHESTPPRSAGAISGAVYDEHNRPASR
jgi:hypothetical protein